MAARSCWTSFTGLPRYRCRAPPSPRRDHGATPPPRRTAARCAGGQPIPGSGGCLRLRGPAPTPGGGGGSATDSNGSVPSRWTKRPSFWPGPRGTGATRPPAWSANRSSSWATCPKVVELRHPLTPGADLADRLGAAEHQDRQDGQLRLVDAEGVPEHVFVAHDRPAVGRVDKAGQALLLEGPDGQLGGGLVIGDHRIAVRGLVTGQGQRVEAQGILLGVVSCFSMRQPSTRSSSADSSGRSTPAAVVIGIQSSTGPAGERCRGPTRIYDWTCSLPRP